MREEFFIRMKVYDDETPELFQRLARLPAGRIARRTALLRVLHAGFAAIESKTEQVLRDGYVTGLEVVPALQAVERSNPPAVSCVSGVAKTMAANEKPREQVVLDPSDLAEFFGASVTQ